MTTQHEIKKLTRERVEEAAAMMVRAFLDYPMWTWIVPDETQRREGLLASARSSLLWGQLFSESYAIGEPIRGLTVWAPPGMADADIDPDGSRTRRENVARIIGPDGMRRLEAMSAIQRPPRDRYLPADGWYLPQLAVDPVAQRTGMGTALLRNMFARLDPQGVATYLETEKAANVPYYQSHGYRVVHNGVLPEDGPEFWCFLRTPGA